MADVAVPGPPGSLRFSRGIYAACGDGAALQILEVQMEGRKRMPAEAFANGQRLTENDCLGEQQS